MATSKLRSRLGSGSPQRTELPWPRSATSTGRLRPGARARRSTTQNGRAGLLLKQARLASGSSQELFAAALSAALGVKVSPSSLSYFEAGKNTVPAAIYLAALEVAD